MSKLAKTVVTVILVVVFILLFALITLEQEASGRKTPGFLSRVRLAGLIGGIRAVWKKKKGNGENNSGSSVLQQ